MVWILATTERLQEILRDSKQNDIDKTSPDRAGFFYAIQLLKFYCRIIFPIALLSLVLNR